MSDLQFLNGLASLVCAIVFSGVVLSDRVKDGVVIKTGLIATIAGSVVTFMLTVEESRNWDAYALANLITRVGLIVAFGGAVYRARKHLPWSKKKSTAHSERTNQQINVMAEQARDLADLYIESSPAPLEKEKNGRTKV